MKSGFSAIGKLVVFFVLLVTFFVGLFGVVYLQLKGEEVEIPKVVGKNFNDGRDDLAGLGLRIKKIATRYSNEAPNTILEQRPRAGSTAKTGLMISVVVSESNPDGNELPVDIKDDEEVIEEIGQQPELKIDQPKKKAPTTKKPPKTRDVEVKTPEDEATGGDEKPVGGNETPKEPGAEEKSAQKPTITSPPALKPTPAPNKSPATKPPVKPPAKPPKQAADTKTKKTSGSN